jgi:hypothetical protein
MTNVQKSTACATAVDISAYTGVIRFAAAVFTVRFFKL